MTIIKPHYVFLPTGICKESAIAFRDTIEKIAPLDVLQKEFPNAKTTLLQEHSLLMPGLINAHVHLEFSANKTQLHYGDFMQWLYSVIKHREDLMQKCASKCMNERVESMLDKGITTFGAISSYGLDLDACENAKQNVVYFNELIGSQATMADALFSDFNSRLDASVSIKRKGFYPAVAIHSPYSVHPVLVKKALELVREKNYPLSAHFLESQAEREWLDSSEGEFKEFFETLLKQSYNANDSLEFLENFNNTPTLFTHATKTQESELEILAQNKHTVVHCPISNRLLQNGVLNIKELLKQNINLVTATDGLSSNYTLDLFEEMKIALFMHAELPLLETAQLLIDSVTKNAAQALNINTGEIIEGKNADFLILDLDAPPSENFPIHLILNSYNISKIYINGLLQKGTL